MIAQSRRHLSVALSIVLVSTSSQVALGYQAPASAPAAGLGNPAATAPESASELQGLEAPIALYPDQLVAIILGAATFPDQIAVADYWLGEHKNLTGAALSEAVGKEQWDVSVKALTQFPSVLHNMARNLVWTSSLGEAYQNQQADVMAAIQTLRAQAKAAGNLKSTPQITVQETSPQTIVIEPATPEIVYVPEYNPTVVYGTPYVTPGYSAGVVAATSLLSFGAGVAVGAAVSGGWGWSSWGCNWHGGGAVYQQNNFYGNNGWHGGYNGGYNHGNGYGGPNMNRNGNAFQNDGNRNVRGNTVNVNRESAQNSPANRTAGSNTGAEREGNAGKSAFGGMGGHSSGFGNGGGWSSRAQSSRGWGSMRSSGIRRR